MSGKVYIAGAGPGDPELITVKAKRLLEEADVIVYDHLVNRKLLELAKPSAEKIYVGKVAGRHSVSQDEINEILVRKAKEGKTVLRLKGGDPLIFGRVGEEMESLKESGVEFEVIPGVTAASACAARAGVPLSHRDKASVICLATGHRKEGKPLDLNFKAMAEVGATLIFYMAVSSCGEIAERLMKEGLSPDTPVLICCSVGLDEERFIRTTLSELEKTVRERSVKSPALFIIGGALKN